MLSYRTTISTNNGTDIKVADVNNDGKPDIMMTQAAISAVEVFLNNSTPGTINFDPQVNLVTTAVPSNMALGDFDNDGKTDIATIVGSAINILRNNNSTPGGAVAFDANVNIALPATPGNIESGDVDGDGKTDLVMNAGNVYMLRNTSSGAGNIAFGQNATITNAGTGGLWVTDIDNDGFTDIATSNSSTNNVDVFRYNIATFYTRQTGNWNDPNTWSTTCGGTAGAIFPTTSDNVVICNGHTVTLTANATCNNLAINSGGTLKPASFNLVVNGSTNKSGTFLDDVAGGTNTFTRTFTVNTGGSFTTASAGMNYFVFRGDITNNGTGIIDIGANTDYTFNPVAASLTITANGTDRTWFCTNGGGTKAGHVATSKTVIVAAGTSTVELFGDDVNGLEILAGATVTNQKPAVGNHLRTNLLRGAGTFVNTNAALLYDGIARPMATGGGTFTFGTGDFVGYYSGGSQDVAAGTYNNIAFANGGTKTLLGNITVNGSFDINYATLDVSANNYSINLVGSTFTVLNTGSFIPRSGTVTLSGGDNASLYGAATPTINFYNLVINKTLATDQTILQNPATVSNTLTLTKGILYLQNGDLTLTNPTPANQILPATPTSASYIATTNNNRALVRQNLAGAGTYTFPVGNATQYQPFVITNPSPTVSVRFGTPTATVPTSGVGSWFVSNGSATSTVRFNNPQGGSLLTGISAVGKYNAGAWTAMSGTTYPTATDYSISNVFAGSTVEFGILTTNAFRTTWLTTAASESITIPVFNGPTYTCTVDWGDGSSNTYNSVNPNITHVYATAGTYTVSIAGTFPRIYFNDVSPNDTKIRTIEQWGNIAWTSMQNAFFGCNTLTYNATDTPNFSVGSFSCEGMFRGCSAFNGNATMNSWNTANVISMNRMFTNAGAFNQNIGSWNTSAVTDMQYMFNGAGNFNQPIGTWNTSVVTNMTYMFSGASAFNQNIGGWNTGAVTNTNNMFAYCPFNQNISGWNVGNVTNMGGMFVGNSAFNQNIGSWNVGKVNNFFGTFQNATSFNQTLNWNIGATATGISMLDMFSGATAFNQSLASWDITDVTNFTGMLDNCGMNTANYDATLIGWAGQASLPTGVTLGATGRAYCTSLAARDILDTGKTWTFSGDSNACPSFSALTATNVTGTSFTANWTGVIGATSYDIEISTSGSFSGTPTQTGITGVSSVRSGLSPNTAYYYKVRQGTPSAGAWSNTKMTSTSLPAGSGKDLNMGGASDYISITSTALNFSGSNAYTFEAWIKVPSLGVARGIAERTAPIGGNMQISMGINASGQLKFDTDDFSENSWSGIMTTASITAGNWTHVAFVASNASTKSIYINGVLQTTTPTGLSPDNTSPSGTNPWSIGESILEGTFTGEMDEIKIWNTTRTQPQIRDAMCAKLAGNESGLVAYFRLDENTGIVTENKAYGATFDGTLIGSPTWATSGAPLGNVSANTYGGSTVTLTNTDAMTANNFLGSPAGVHLYKVNATPNATGVPSNYTSLYTDRYWGMFFVGGTTPTANLAYSYGNNSAVDVANALRFAQRDNNADATWASLGGVVQRLVKRLSHGKTSAGEFILAERNAVITNYKDGGTIHTYTGTSSQHTALAGRYVQNNFTIEFWLRTTQTGTGTAGQWETGTGLVTANSAGTNDFGITLIGSKVAFGTGAAANTVSSTSNVNDGKWYHIAATRSSGTITLFVNGRQESTLNTGFTNTLNDATAIHIGKRFTGGNFFTGSLDELRIWSVALPATTLKDWINLRAYDSHPNFLALEAYHRFDENIGTASEDLINGNDATMVNGVVWADADMPLGDGAVTRLTVPATSNTISVFPEAGVTMNFGAVTPNGEVVVTRVDSEPESYPAVAGMNFMSSYWVVRNYGTNQTFSALPEIKFEVPAGNTISATDLASPNNIKLYKRPDDAIGSTVGVGNWTGVASATGFGSVKFASNFAASGSPTQVEDFSQFVIGSPSSALPITLLGLKGRRVEGLMGETTEEVRLEWSTASEINNKGFGVEMSENGLAYRNIAFIEGRGNSTTVSSYQIAVSNANEAYYRLKQIDFDGTFSYSPVVFVEGMAGKDFVRVYPNPTQTEINLEFSENILPAQLIRAEVYSITGKRIWRGVGKREEVQASLRLASREWKTGTYLLQIRTDNKKLQTKFIKQ